MAVHESDWTKSNSKRKNPGRVWPDWYLVLATFRNSDNRRATWQLINTIVPYGVMWYLMIRSIQLGYSYTVTLILALPAAAFMVRLFILFHDCVHGSFFRQQGANTFFGYLLGVLVLTPFEDWRFAHLRHHVTYANLDARGFGDIWTMTLTEHENASKASGSHCAPPWKAVHFTNCLLCCGGFPVILVITMSTI